MADAYPLQALLRDVAGIVVEEEQPARIVRLVAPFLRRFADGGSGLPDYVLRTRHEQGVAYLLHEEGDDSFFVVATVLPPGAASGIHYHGGWRVAILLRGEQEEITYRRADEGSDLSCAELVEAGRERHTVGSLSSLPDGGYHSAQNAGSHELLVLALLSGTPDDHPYYRYDDEAKALRRAEFVFRKGDR